MQHVPPATLDDELALAANIIALAGQCGRSWLQCAQESRGAEKSVWRNAV